MSNIKIVRMRTRGVVGKVKAYFTVSIGPLEIDDMKLIDGSNGLFIAFPNRKWSKPGEGDKYVDVVRLARSPTGKYTKGSQELYDAIYKAAIEEFTRREGEVATAGADTEVDDDLPF